MICALVELAGILADEPGFAEMIKGTVDRVLYMLGIQ